MEGKEMKKGTKKSKKGFTLIELVVVIAILGILAAILIPVISGFIARANIARDQANARNLFNCLAMFCATDSATTALSGVVVDPVLAGITPLFGTTTKVISAVIVNDVVTSATFNGVTYHGDGTFTGTPTP
jgi:type IV pilus assembly protein PilA